MRKRYEIYANNIVDKLSKAKPPKIIIHNFSSYDITEEEIQALSHGLDQHIPSNSDRYKINTAFEYFYQNILNDISEFTAASLT